MNWVKNNKWKITRRIVQIGVILLLMTPIFGFSFFKGTLISSEIFGISLTDPFAFLDYTLATKTIYLPLLVSAILILGFYFLVGGRVFCSWICPIFILTEISEKLHDKFGVFNYKPSDSQKYWVLGVLLVLSLVTSKPVFEWISPIGIISQNIALGVDFQGSEFGSELALGSGEDFGTSKEFLIEGRNETEWRFLFNSSLWLIFAIFLIDVFVAKGWWCKSTCPVGAFYSIVHKTSPTKIKIDHEVCTSCGDCFKVCLVSEVLKEPVKGTTKWVNDGVCTNCMNCVDACPENALKLGLKIKQE
ncbi:MAG: 4Fe-4S binding protein [Calditrichaeota bacterium]|nr:MAG: 4Fe-4S binding protein [Calditrichota bacterium]